MTHTNEDLHIYGPTQLFSHIKKVFITTTLTQSTTVLKSAMISVKRPGMTMSLCQESSPMMIAEAMATTQRPNSSLHWNSLQSPRQKKAQQVRKTAKHAGGFLRR